jgi:hypothetical protein
MVSIFNVLVVNFSYYLRPHKKEPYMVLSILGAVGTGGVTLFCARWLGIQGVVIGYGLVTVALFPMALKVFKDCRMKWSLPQTII